MRTCKVRSGLRRRPRLVTAAAALAPPRRRPRQLLVYLWRVHGVDFYGGREYSDPGERGRATARRTRRGPRPSDGAAAAAAAGEDEGAAAGSAGEGEAAAAGDERAEAPPAADGQGEGGDADAATPADEAASPTKQQQQQQQQREGQAAARRGGEGGEGGRGQPDEAAEYERRVAGFWRLRLERGDPLEGPQQKKVGAGSWVLHPPGWSARAGVRLGPPLSCGRRLPAAAAAPATRLLLPGLAIAASALPLAAAQIEEALEGWVDSQIVKIEDNKWGNKLSSVRRPCCCCSCCCCRSCCCSCCCCCCCCRSLLLLLGR